MTRSVFSLALGAVVLLAMERPAPADTLRLKDGRVIHGKRIGSINGKIAFRVDGKIQFFPHSEVKATGEGEESTTTARPASDPKISLKPKTKGIEALSWKITRVEQKASSLAQGGGGFTLGFSESGSASRYLYVHLQFSRPATRFDLLSFTVKNTRGQVLGKLDSYREGVNAVIVFDGSWSNQFGLTLHGLGRKDPLFLGTPDSGNAKALLDAARKGDVVSLRRLLAQGGSVNSRDTINDTPLHVAVCSGNMKAIELLLDAGANMESRGFCGRTPLWNAADSGNLEVVKLLIERGANIHTTDIDGENICWAAARHGGARVVEFLTAKGVPLESQGKSQNTLLHLVSTAGLHDEFDRLIAQGADPNVRNADRETPLHLVARFGTVDVAKRLIAAGARIDARAKDQSTPLIYAAHRLEVDMTKALLEEGADANARTATGETALHVLLTWYYSDARSEILKIARLLLENGADTNRKTKDGKTPLDIALRPYGEAKDDKELMELLKSHGAKRGQDVVKEKGEGQAIADEPTGRHDPRAEAILNSAQELLGRRTGKGKGKRLAGLRKLKTILEEYPDSVQAEEAVKLLERAIGRGPKSKAAAEARTAVTAWRSKHD